MNRLLKEHGLDMVESCLDVFEWADKKFVPSCYELEPIEDSKVVYCGTLKKSVVRVSNRRDKIIAYMGNGTISVKKMLKEVSAAFAGSRYEVFIAGHGLKDSTNANIHTAPYFDFLIPSAGRVVSDWPFFSVSMKRLRPQVVSLFDTSMT